MVWEAEALYPGLICPTQSMLNLLMLINSRLSLADFISTFWKPNTFLYDWSFKYAAWIIYFCTCLVKIYATRSQHNSFLDYSTNRIFLANFCSFLQVISAIIVLSPVLCSAEIWIPDIRYPRNLKWAKTQAASLWMDVRYKLNVALFCLTNRTWML